MKKETTSVTIEKSAAAKLDRLAASAGVTKKDFVSFALDYFERYGINPVAHESPAKEMQKLIDKTDQAIKRNEQVIGFIRKQEQDILRPMVEAVSAVEARMKTEYATKADLKKFTEIVGDSYMKLLEGLKK